MLAAMPSFAEPNDYAIQPVPFTQVHLDGGFWGPRQETSRKVTIPYCFQKCEETGRIDNFAKAGGLMEGPFEGIRFNDSDVFKVVEGAAYSLAVHPDPELDAYLDDLIAKIAAAQEDDGYLYTTRTIDPENPAKGAGDTRWSYLKQSHELYNVGHMYEAAVAHYEATGKRTLLDVAVKSADLIDAVFGVDGRRDVPGHEEIEIGLVKLYRAAGETRYLDLARFFTDERGRANGRELQGPYTQDHLPVVEQTEAVGHAVRAGYLYTAMADIAALTGDRAYTDALDRIWTDVASRKLYVTGGIGAQRHGEAFGEPYELPNLIAYSETCAAIANCLWNHRMFLLHGDAKYMDVFETTLYNGFLAGVSLSGDRFFYPNPLESDGAYTFNHGSLSREPWFGCSCCPVNVARFIPSLSGYVYANSADTVYVNLYIDGEGAAELAGNTVNLTQKTRYPWEGDVEITVEPEEPAEFAVLLRVPAWTGGAPLPGGLYEFLEPAGQTPRLEINGASVPVKTSKGYVAVRRQWNKGDTLRLHLPMPVRRVVADPRVEADAGKAAIQRGPLVYCLEAVDNDGWVRNLALPDAAELTARHEPDLLDGLILVTGPGTAKQRKEEDAPVTFEPVEMTAVPYYAWNHRGEGEMRVWIPRDVMLAEAAPAPTIAGTSRASASHCHERDTVRALNDQQEPADSNGHDVARFTWWDHRGTAEWVQYDFAQPARVHALEVYWFDDTGVGQCRVPASWRAFYLENGKWKEVDADSGYGTEKDRFNRVTFDPVTTGTLRLQVQLQPGFSGGILEWRIEGEAVDAP